MKFTVALMVVLLVLARGNLVSSRKGKAPAQKKEQGPNCCAQASNENDCRTPLAGNRWTGKTSETTCSKNTARCQHNNNNNMLRQTWTTCQAYTVRVTSWAKEGVMIKTASAAYGLTMDKLDGVWKTVVQWLPEHDWGDVHRWSWWSIQDGTIWLKNLAWTGWKSLTAWISSDCIHFSFSFIVENQFRDDVFTWRDALFLLFVVNLVLVSVCLLIEFIISPRNMPFTTLETTNFPLYAVNVLDREHFLIAGGGGAAKTGVPNALNIYKLGRSGKDLKAMQVHNFEAGRRPIMNCAVHPTANVLAVGMDNKCQLLEVDIKEEVRNVEKAKGKNKVVVKEKSKRFIVNELQSTVTVSAEDGDEKDDDVGFQKVVRFTADGNYIVTGGSDGHVRVLKYPSLECAHDIKAHSTDVDDLDVHPNSIQFVTCSRDTTAYVWRLQEGKKQFQLHFSVNDQDNFFRIRACRFGRNERKDVFLYTINVPAKFNRKTPTPSYLVKWDCSKWLPQMSQAAGMEPLTQMAVSGNGTFIGVGTAEGDISVFIAWNLAPLTTLKGVHNIFVTGLEFLPDSPLVNDQLHNEFALLSISADNACKVTTIRRRSEYSLWWILVGFLVLLYLTVMALAYAGFDL